MTSPSVPPANPIRVLREQVEHLARAARSDRTHDPTLNVLATDDVLAAVEALVVAAQNAVAMLGPGDTHCPCDGCDCENKMAAHELELALRPFAAANERETA